MSKGASEKVSLELTFLEALDSIHADVDTSEIAEIQDWSRAVRGKFYGASITEPSHLSRLKAGLLSALRRPIAANAPVSSSGGVSRGVLGASGSMAIHGNVQYSQMAIPQLIVVCTSESSEAAWSEFVRRFQPLITSVIAKVVRRYGKVSPDLVDDLIQETLLKLCHDNLRALRGFVTAHEKFFQGFLKAVATNVAVDHFRTTAAFKMGGGGELKAPKASRVFSEYELSRDSASDPERKVLLEEIDSVLRTHQHEPNFERDYAIFWLYYRHGLSAKEISDLPGIKLTVKGVESTLLRLTRQIRSALTQRTKNPQ
jgi:RNA polymerase sigma-70 factor (ECF subfamily)